MLSLFRILTVCCVFVFFTIEASSAVQSEGCVRSLFKNAMNASSPRTLYGYIAEKELIQLVRKGKHKNAPEESIRSAARRLIDEVHARFVEFRGAVLIFRSETRAGKLRKISGAAIKGSKTTNFVAHLALERCSLADLSVGNFGSLVGWVQGRLTKN